MIGAIEQAMIDRVKAASADGVLGYELREVDSYADQLTPDNIKRAAQNFPAVLFVFLGEPAPEDAPGGGERRRPRFAAFVCQDNRRNEKARRRGADGKVGSYQMAEDVKALFFNQTLGLDLNGPIRGGAIRSMFNSGGLSVYAVEFTAVFDWNPALADAATLDDFSTFHADWDVPPHGNVTEPLPAAEADASDTLTNLETS